MKNNEIKFITRTGIFLAVILIVQMGGFPQPITGPPVNTIFYLSVLLVGSWSGIIIDICTPVVAFVRGILPTFTKFPMKYKRSVSFTKIFLDYISI